MAVDGTIIDIDLIILSHVHPLIPPFDKARALRKSLQQQKFGDRE